MLLGIDEVGMGSLAVGLCACGCGEKTTFYKGRYRKFVAGHHARGRNNPRFGKKVDGELREKISQARKAQGNPWWVGRKHTAVAKQHMSVAHTGQPSQKIGEWRKCAYSSCGEAVYLKPHEAKNRMFAYCSHKCQNLDYAKRFVGSKNPFFGKTHTEETREKCRAGALKQRSSGIVLPTVPERRVQEELTRRGIEFIPEHPLGKWCVDIFIPSLNMAVFVDGCYWHRCPVHFPSDKKCIGDSGRVPYLTKCGYRVALIWEHDIKEDVCRAVTQALSS